MSSLVATETDLTKRASPIQRDSREAACSNIRIMEIRQSILGEVAIRSRGRVSGADVGALVRRLLLFDRVVLKSVQLQEIVFLVRAFGRTGFLQLLDSGALQITCQFSFIITDVARDGVRQLPLCHFSFGVGTLGEQERILRRGLLPLQSIPGLKNSERESLGETVIRTLVAPPEDYGPQIQAQIESDLRNNNPAIKEAIADQLEGSLGTGPKRICVSTEETEPRVFRVVTNLADFGISEQRTHHILHGSISALANLDQRLAEMAAYSAITGFMDSEAHLLFGKLAGIIAPQNPKPLEERFARVVEIAELPDLVSGQRIDVDRLLRARDSAECREFRSWLSNLRDVSDEQIAEMIGGVKEKLGLMVRSGPGKIVRFAATTAAGLIPALGVIAGPALGAVDSFLLERMLPSSGIMAFLSTTYPSLFVAP
jgi:hypothetical protein